LGLLAHGHLLRRRRQRADRGRFGLGLLAAIGEIGRPRGLLGGPRLGLGVGLCARLGVRRRSRGLRFLGVLARRGALGLRLLLLRVFGRGMRGRALFGFALARFRLFALAALFRQVFFLAADQLRLATRFFLAAREFGFVDVLHGRRCFLLGRLDDGGVAAFFALDERALLT